MTIIKAMGDLCFDLINMILAIILISNTFVCSIFSSDIIQYIKQDEKRKELVIMKYIITFFAILIYAILFVTMCYRYSRYKKNELNNKEKLKKEEKKLEKELENTKQYLEILKNSVTIEEYETQKTYLKIKTRSYITCTKFELQEMNDNYFITIVVEQNDEEIHTDCFSISKPKPQPSKIIIN